MTDLELAVLLAAKEWWRAKRPRGWSELEHLRNPTVDCIPALGEPALANAVARRLRDMLANDIEI